MLFLQLRVLVTIHTSPCFFPSIICGFRSSHRLSFSHSLCNSDNFVRFYSVHHYLDHLRGSLSVHHNSIGGIMVSLLTSSVVDREFEPRSGLTKDYKIGICCFSAKYVALSRKSKDWLAWNQNNVSEWRDMSICGLLFQWASTIQIQLSVLV
jgi:hypothetical protein